MEIIKKTLNWFDAFQRAHPFVGFPYAVIKKYGDDEAGKQAALLAYYGFLSLFPLLLVLTTSLKLFFNHNPTVRDQILAGATDYFPSLGDNLQPSHSLSGAGVALGVGILLTLFGTRGVADVFRGAVNHVWEVPVVKRTGFPMAMIKSFSIILIGGLGLISAPIIAGYAVSFGHNLFFALIGLLVTVAILFAVFLFLIHVSLSVARPLKDIWLGALTAAVGLAILQSLGNILIKSHLKSLNNLYATFAISLGLLYWLYLQTQVIMYALEIDSVRVFKLAPRSVNQDVLTEQDRAAFRLYAHRNKFHDEEDIEVRTSTKKRPLLERLRNLGEEKTD